MYENILNRTKYSNNFFNPFNKKYPNYSENMRFLRTMYQIKQMKELKDRENQEFLLSSSINSTKKSQEKRIRPLFFSYKNTNNNLLVQKSRSFSDISLNLINKKPIKYDFYPRQIKIKKKLLSNMKNEDINKYININKQNNIILLENWYNYNNKLVSSKSDMEIKYKSINLSKGFKNRFEGIQYYIRDIDKMETFNDHIRKVYDAKLKSKSRLDLFLKNKNLELLKSKKIIK